MAHYVWHWASHHRALLDFNMEAMRTVENIFDEVNKFRTQILAILFPFPLPIDISPAYFHDKPYFES